MASMINPDEYSASETLITFPTPIPLLRKPIPDDNNNTLILGFQNPNSFSSAYKSCKSSILTQCESAARIGCSLTASNNCKPPWWKSLFGLSVSSEEMKEREKCEEREMMRCLEGARINCREFAENNCGMAFRDARVVVGGGVESNLVEMIGRVCFGGDRNWFGVKARNGVRIVRGSDLLDKR